MNGYKCFFKLRGSAVEMEVEAETSYQAQLIVVKQTGVKGHTITTVLCEKDGEQITHQGAAI